MENYRNIFNRKYINIIKIAVILSLCGLFFSKFLLINVSILPWTTSLLALFLLVINFGKRFKKNIVIIGFLSILFQLISTLIFSNHLFYNLNTLGSNANFLSWALYILILGAISTGYCRITNDDIKEIMSFLLNVVFLSAVVVFILDFNKIGYIFSGIFNSYRSAMWGFFLNKNMFGMVCALGTVAGIFCIFNRQKMQINILKCTFLIIMTVFSFSRTALLFLSIYLIAFLIQNFKMPNRTDRTINRRLFIAFIIIIGICLIIIFRNANLKSIVENNLLRLDIGDAGRKNIQYEFLKEFKEKGFLAEVFGIGYSEYNFLCSIDVHSAYLYTYVTGGIIKVISFFILLIFTLKTNIQCKNKLLSHNGVSVLLAFLVISFFETYAPFEIGLSNMLLFIYLLLLPSISEE